MNRAKLFATVRTSVFRGSLSQSQVDGIEAILDEAGHAETDHRWLASMLAMPVIETAATMQPVIETRQPDEDANR